MLLTYHKQLFVLCIMTVEFLNANNPTKKILVSAQVQPKYYKTYSTLKYQSKVKIKVSL